MMEVKFMTEAQKCEITDQCKRCKANKDKEKEKSKHKQNDSDKDDNSLNSLTFSQASTNGKKKHRRGSGG